jgi:prephenate dehydrogenase
VRWNKVTLIGVGLLGGSIGLALRERKLAREVHGFVRRRVAIRESIQAGAVTRAGTDLMEAVRGADLVILCTPISRMERLAGELAPALEKGALVTDVGSVKAPVVRSLSRIIGKAGAQFVGSHPMAGSECGGVRSAQSGLFVDAVCVVTPQASSARAAVRRVRMLWESLGARVLTMDAALHDKLVSSASHLPHLLACALASQVLDPREDKRQAALCATGFRDTTRVACGAPEMWRDIALANRRNLIRDLARFEQGLAGLRRCLEEADVPRLEAFLSEAQRRRIRWKHARHSKSRSPE